MASTSTSVFGDKLCDYLEIDDKGKSTAYLLEHLLINLDVGRTGPTERCFKVLTAIAAKSQLEPALGAEWKQHSLEAKRILDMHFYTHPNSGGAENKGEDENKGSESDEKWEVGQSTFDYFPTELTAPFPGVPGLAGLIGGYYSNCALLTQDGQKCGLGNNGGFQYRYQHPSTTGPTAPTASIGAAEESYCAQECATDLCPQWLGSLLTRAPTKVNIEFTTRPISRNGIGVRERFQVKISSSNLRIGGTSWGVIFKNGLPIDLSLGAVAAGCRLLGSQRKSGENVLNVEIYLDKSDPQYIAHSPYLDNNTQIQINFPEFPSGYFVNSDLWTYSHHFASLAASLVIPSSEEYEKLRNEQFAVRKLERFIASQSVQAARAIQLPQSQSSQSSQSSLLYSSSPSQTSKRTFTGYSGASGMSGSAQLPTSGGGRGGGGGEPDEEDEDNYRIRLSKAGRFQDDE